MRAMFSILGLLAVVVIVGLLARKQLTAAPSAPVAAPPVAEGAAPLPAGTPRQQLDQVRQSIEAATPPRAMPDEAK